MELLELSPTHVPLENFRSVAWKDVTRIAAAIPRFLNLFVELSNKCVQLSRGILSESDAILDFVPGQNSKLLMNGFLWKFRAIVKYDRNAGNSTLFSVTMVTTEWKQKLFTITKPIFFTQFLIVLIN